MLEHFHSVRPFRSMPLFESESIVLRTYNLAEADRIVVFFSREHGIIRGVAKGAKRLKSKFGSTLEPFSTVQLTFFQKEERELVSIQNVDLVRSRFESASDPEYLQAFSYLSDLLTAMVPPHDPNETIFRMVAACLEAPYFDSGGLAAIRLYFELWLLRLGGYLPSWDRCSQCANALAENEPAWLLSDFHLLCERCRPSRALTQIAPLHQLLFRRAQRITPTDFIELARDSAEAAGELSELLRRIVTQIVGRELRPERSLAVNS